MTYLVIGAIILLALDITVKVITKNKSSNKANRNKSDNYKNDNPTSSTSQNNYQYQRKPFLLTKNELYFYRDLISAADSLDLSVFTKVRLADVIEPRKGQNWNAAFARIRSKHLDFVLCEKQYLRPVLAIELDDNSHQKETRQERDLFVNFALESSHFPILRVKGGAGLTEKIQALLTQEEKSPTGR